MLAIRRRRRSSTGWTKKRRRNEGRSSFGKSFLRPSPRLASEQVPRAWWRLVCKPDRSDLLQQQTRVVAAEAEAVAHGVADLFVLGFAGGVVEIALGVG